MFDDLGVSMIAPDSIGATPVEIRLISLVLLRLVGRSANQTDRLEPPHVLPGGICSSTGPIGNLSDRRWFAELQGYREKVTSRF